ncbi:MAG: hypothetical protein JWL81_2666 [Verrucomicrobiales bacterium]|nr:hypothetical protein [Verrucomicrobiales bacterium]
MSPEKRKNLLSHLWCGCAFAAVAFVVGIFLGFRQGKFAAGLEENKIALNCLKQKEISISPEFREFLKGRIYCNLASNFPNDAGYLLRRDWDFGPVDKDILKRSLYAKGPNDSADSFDAATEDLSTAEKPTIKTPAMDDSTLLGQPTTSQP